MVGRQEGKAREEQRAQNKAGATNRIVEPTVHTLAGYPNNK